MADPFSIVAGTASLADVLWRVGAAIKRVHDSAGRIDEDIAELERDIHALKSINSSMQQKFHEKRRKPPGSSPSNAKCIEDLWRLVPTFLTDCATILSDLEALINDMIGPEEPSKLSGKMGALKKTFRKEKRINEFKEKRQRMTNCQISLQMLLSALNLSYSQTSQDSTDLSIGHLSKTVQGLAFTLQYEIASLRARVPEDHGDHFLDAINSASAAAKLVSINRYFSVPQTVSSIFTGRSSLLEELQKAFDVFQVWNDPSNVQKRFIIYGMGGSGKTQFCCKFAQDNQDNFWGIFYIDASTPITAESSFSRIVKTAGIAPSEGSNQRAAKEWLVAQKERWLLLIDNADDPECALEDYFPDGKRGCILVTTRIPAHKIHGTVGRKSYRFEQLPPDEANDLLLKAAGKPSPWDIRTRNLAEPISRVLGFLPLALIQAGTAILRELCTWSNYEEYLKQTWERIRKARYNRGIPDDEENMHVYSSYEINLGSLEKSNVQSHIDAVQLLKTFSCFHFENIRVDVLMKAATNPCIEREHQREEEEEQLRSKDVLKTKSPAEYLREKAFDLLMFIFRDRSPPVLPSVLQENASLAGELEIRLRRALRHLTDMSLIIHHENEITDSYSMHPLWHRWVRERPKMRLAEQALWCQAAKTTLAQSILLPPHGSSEQEQSMRRSLLPHVNHVRSCQMEIDKKLRENKLLRQKSTAQFLREVVVNNLAPKQTLGVREALILAKFSRVYMECTFWREAEQLQLKVKEFVYDKLGPEHPRAMGISQFLAATYMVQTRANEAAELYNQVLQVYIKSLGPRHPKTHKMMDTLGESRCFQGRFKEALILHETAIQAMEKSFQGESEEVLWQIEEEADRMKRVGSADFDKALGFSGEAIKRMRGRSVTKPEDLFMAWGHLGGILWRYFRYEEAQKYHKKASLGLLALLGPADSRTEIAMLELAASHMDFEGELSCGGPETLDDARAILQTLFERRRKTLGQESPLTLLVLGQLARIESVRGNHEEAERSFRKILPIVERTLGSYHFGTLAARAHFAKVLIRQGQFDEAENLLAKSIEKSKYKNAARKDGNHPDHIMALWHLVRYYELRGKIQDAVLRVKELEHVLDSIGGEGLGKEHPFARKVAVKRAELEGMERAEVLRSL